MLVGSVFVFLYICRLLLPFFKKDQEWAGQKDGGIGAGKDADQKREGEVLCGAATKEVECKEDEHGGEGGVE